MDRNVKESQVDSRGRGRGMPETRLVRAGRHVTQILERRPSRAKHSLAPSGPWAGNQSRCVGFRGLALPYRPYPLGGLGLDPNTRDLDP